jgi:predicted XRE-type DNA-binding protein
MIGKAPEWIEDPECPYDPNDPSAVEEFWKNATVRLPGQRGTAITLSSGNVFKDLGFAEDEAENLRIRSSLMIAAQSLIEDRSLTQAEAAKLFRVTQRRISNLVRGKIDLFSIDTLIDMLARAGVHADIVLICPSGSRLI